MVDRGGCGAVWAGDGGLAGAAGLVHRDVKPANMLVDARPGRSDHVYLSDFGLSKKTAAASAGLTGTGHFLGTLDYVAPEQIQGRPADGRMDQYGLACAAFELLTGAPPFQREEAAAVMYAHLSDPPPPVTSRRPGLPAGADQAVARALAKAPAAATPAARSSPMPCCTRWAPPRPAPRTGRARTGPSACPGRHGTPPARPRRPADPRCRHPGAADASR